MTHAVISQLSLVLHLGEHKVKAQSINKRIIIHVGHVLVWLPSDFSMRLLPANGYRDEASLCETQLACGK